MRISLFGTVFLSLASLLAPCQSVLLSADSPQQTTARVLITITGDTPQKDQLTAVVDGHPAQIDDLTSGKDQPLVFALLFDISGSARDKEAFERQSSLELLRALLARGYTGYFGDFNEEIYLGHKFASEDPAQKELKSIGEFRGGSAVYDAVVAAAKLVNHTAAQTQARRAIFVLTDGRDNASRIGFKEAVREIQQVGVPVYFVGLVADPREQKAIREMETLSGQTGGTLILLARPKPFISQLLQLLENQYWMTVISPVAPDHKLHSLSVETPQKKIQLSIPAQIVAR